MLDNETFICLFTPLRYENIVYSLELPNVIFDIALITFFVLYKLSLGAISLTNRPC